MTDNAITRNAKQLAALADKIEDSQRTGCDCCDPTSPSPDPVVVRLEREVEELKKRLKSARVCLARIALHDTEDQSESEFAKDALEYPTTHELWLIVKSGGE